MDTDERNAKRIAVKNCCVAFGVFLGKPVGEVARVLLQQDHNCKREKKTTKTMASKFS